MKKYLISFLIIVLVIISGFYIKKQFFKSEVEVENFTKDISNSNRNNKLQDGDIIFQASLSHQSKAIKIATKSKYSHCGIIYSENGEFFVLEAIQPVKSTNLSEWIARGDDSHYVVKRLKNSEKILTPDVLQKMKSEGDKFKGKNYDLAFEWSDDDIYCSELIWKIYNRTTGLEIGKLQKLKDFDLTNEIVQSKIKERYGNSIPLDEIVISPESIFQSDLLETIVEK